MNGGRDEVSKGAVMHGERRLRKSMKVGQGERKEIGVELENEQEGA